MGAESLIVGRVGGTPGPIRTADLLLRRQTLYPAELRAQNPMCSSIVIARRRRVKPGLWYDAF
jgi:hypothetical protein